MMESTGVSSIEVALIIMWSLCTVKAVNRKVADCKVEKSRDKQNHGLGLFNALEHILMILVWLLKHQCGEVLPERSGDYPFRNNLL